MSINSFDIKAVKRVHMIGVGGIGMSGLARLFLHEGKEVSGSDRTPSLITDALVKEGLKFYPQSGHADVFVDDSSVDMVVYTEAMAKDYPEMEAARKLNVPMVNYFEALAKVANQYYLIAVAGTHGKTTTTAMLIDILEEASYDPTAIVGSLRTKTKSNYKAGKSKYFIVEADEYRENFQYFLPEILVITNIDHDHVDYYPTLADVQNAFRKVAMKVPTSGAVVTLVADKQVAPVLAGLSCNVIDYKESLDLKLDLVQPGLHNRLNAAAARAVAEFLGIEDSVIKKALLNFKGTWRRFEYKGEINGAPIYDDYAHNPQKITGAINSAREKYPDKKLTVVFQPHTYTRTEVLFNEFVTALSLADEVVLVPIYAAREVNESGVSSDRLAIAIGEKARAVPNLEEAAQFIKKTADSSRVILVVGAGDVTKVTEILFS